jgi:YbbR domain-containing protein
MNKRARNKKEAKSTLGLKIISLILAILIWFGISGREMESEQIQYQSYSNILLDFVTPPNTKVIESSINLITVRVAGPEKDISQLTPSDVQVIIDLSNYTAADYKFTLTEDNVQLPDRLTSIVVDKIKPESIDVKLVDWTRKTLQLVCYTMGEPADNYQLDRLELIPKTAVVEGPSDQLEDINHLIAREVDITGLDATKSGALTFDRTMVPQNATIVNLSNLRYRAVITEIQDILQPNQNYPLEVEGDAVLTSEEVTAQVRIEGPISITRWIDPNWIKPVVRFSEVVPPEEDNLEGAGGEGEEATEVTPQPRPVLVPVGHRWDVPEDTKTEFPDWLDRLEKLSLTWFPAEIEILPTSGEGL